MTEASLTAERELGLEAVVASKAMFRARSRLGGSHTVVTFPPLESLAPKVPKELVVGSLQPAKINLYAHVAFCEFLCPFCHYETAFRKLGSGADTRMSKYMAALSREWQSWVERLPGSTISSIYIGGGTPTSIPISYLTRFLEQILRFPSKMRLGSVLNPVQRHLQHQMAARS